MVVSEDVPMRIQGLFVGGRWESGSGHDMRTIRSPVDGRAITSYVEATEDDGRAAVHGARRAWEKSRGRTVFETADDVRRLGELIAERRAEIAAHIVLEHGMPIASARGEVDSAVQMCRQAAEDVVRLAGEYLPTRDPRKRVFTVRRPIGVVVAITPWNYGLAIPLEYVAPALAAGNAVILKPAPSVSGIAGLLAECIEAAGIAPGLFSLVTGSSPATAAALIRHPSVAGVCFTGSSGTGARIHELAAGKYVTTELGGNGPNILLEDADLDQAIPTVASSAFVNSGQLCTAAERVLVHESIYAEVIDRLVSEAKRATLDDPRLESTMMGPVNNEGVASKVDEQLAEAKSMGAHVHVGGARLDDRPTSLYYPATVVSDVPIESSLCSVETFGPVAPVTRFGSDEDVAAIANASPYGLSAAVYTRDLDRGLWFADRLEAGQVIINDSSFYWESHLPFGGWAGKSSGTGRILGRYVFDGLTQIQSVAINSRYP